MRTHLVGLVPSQPGIHEPAHPGAPVPIEGELVPMEGVLAGESMPIEGESMPIEDEHVPIVSELGVGGLFQARDDWEYVDLELQEMEKLWQKSGSPYTNLPARLGQGEARQS